MEWDRDDTRGNKSKFPAKMVEWGHQWNLVDLEENFKCGILYTAKFVD